MIADLQDSDKARFPKKNLVLWVKVSKIDEKYNYVHFAKKISPLVFLFKFVLTNCSASFSKTCFFNYKLNFSNSLENGDIIQCFPGR